MNAYVLHRWLKEHRLGQHQIACDTALPRWSLVLADLGAPKSI